MPSTRDLFRGFDDFFSVSPFASGTNFSPFLTNLESHADAVLRRSSPCYEITEDDDKFRLAVDVPGVKASDMTVQLEHGGRVLRLWGGRKVERAGQVTETRFEKSFTIDQTVDASKITANLADGVLIVTAPKNPVQTDVLKIPITQGAAKL